LKQKEKKKRGPSFYLTPRDFLILKYIWRWKISSTSSVHEAVNREASAYSTYKTLERLERNDFLECRFHLTERFYVWQLTEFGFNSIKEYLGELKEEGYLSENHRHDRLVQAFQLGEWASFDIPQIQFFTEQELRRKDLEDYVDWIPRSNEHRPDGYSKILGEKRTWILAYEVELSIKSPQRYEGILRFYKAIKGIDRVLWMVENAQVMESVLRAKACIKDDSSNYHVFVDLKDFLKNGWDSKIINEHSETLFTMREKYRGILGNPLGECLGNLKGHRRVTAHLNERKVIGKSRS